MKSQPESRIDFVVRNLIAARRRNWPHIAEKAGVPVKTITKIAYGETKDPRTSTTEALHDYFTASAQSNHPSA